MAGRGCDGGHRGPGGGPGLVVSLVLAQVEELVVRGGTDLVVLRHTHQAPPSVQSNGVQRHLLTRNPLLLETGWQELVVRGVVQQC